MKSIAVGVALIGTCQGLRAQETPVSGPARRATAESAAGGANKNADGEKSIAALVVAYAKAFNAGDAAAAAATFAEDALVIDEQGERTDGRAASATSWQRRSRRIPAARSPSRRRPCVSSAPTRRSRRAGRPSLRPGAGRRRLLALPSSTSKRDGHWLQSAVRDEQARDLTPHVRLKELEWMVGDWINESEDAVVLTTCKWADGGNFLLREFTVKMQGKPVLSGTQRIGWDPTRQQFKTWIFDTEGGFGEGYCTRDGEQWVIKAEGVRQDGKHASVTSIITRLGKERANWKSVDRTIGGAAVPGVDEFTIVRKPPEAGK